MKVIFINKPTPMVTGFTMFEKFPTELLKETKTLTITASHETKTRVCTSVSIGDHRSTINWEIEGIKTFQKEEWSFFSGDKNVYNYFVLSKKQNLDVYKEYVTKMLMELCKNLNIDELTVYLITDKVFK